MSSSDEDDDGGWIVGESIHKFRLFFSCMRYIVTRVAAC